VCFMKNRYDRFRFAEFLLWPGDYDFVAGFVVHVFVVVLEF
jgi:hypothetical protein